MSRSVCARAARELLFDAKKKRRKKSADAAARKEKNKKVRHPSRDRGAHLDLAQPRLAAGTLVRRGDLPPVRELLVRPPFPAPRGDLVVVRGVDLVQERASRHRARVARRNERRWLAFADCEETRPRVRERSVVRLASSETLPRDTVARRAKCRPRVSSRVSAGDSCGARRRRAFARASVVSSVASGARNASPGGIRQSGRGEFAREVRFMAFAVSDRVARESNRGLPPGSRPLAKPTDFASRQFSV